jgi:hypothetical protein
MVPFVVVLGFLLAAVGFLVWQVRKRHMNRWLGSYLLGAGKRGMPKPGQKVHVFLCIADHYEPKFKRPEASVARARVQRWLEEYPRQFGRFRDSDGRKPRHTFFYPAEEYESDYLETLVELCAAGHGEVEIHLHHDNDTPEGLRQKLTTFRDSLALQHGLLARHRQTGEVGYAFIHGNWALCNSGVEGRHCGVDNEIDILRETGCFADLTYPSAPSPTQPPKVNSLYYAVNKPGQPASHQTGVDVGGGPVPNAGLLLIQGPLILDWAHRKWFVFPRLENGCLQGTQPPTIDRLPLWLSSRVQVPTRPDWFFVKLYCHGTIENDHEALLGETMVHFHQELAQYARAHAGFHFHYVTAREMYNLVKAAEAGWKGSVGEALDYEYLPGPALACGAEKRESRGGVDPIRL